MILAEQRRHVAAYGRRLRADGLVVGTSGNISVRHGDLVASTPSGVDYEAVTPELVCVTDLAGHLVEGELTPTSELPMHLAIYRQTEHLAVVHTHSTAATAASTLVTELPSAHYLVALFGGPIRVSRYATYGTSELADNVIAALVDRSGCLMANHGTVTVADRLGKAFDLAVYLEWLCEVWLRATTVGAPNLIADDEIERVRQRIAHYGQSVEQTHE